MPANMRYYGRVNPLWRNNALLKNRILIGVLGEESSSYPGTFRFTSTDGYSVPDAHLIYPDGDNSGGGDYTIPRPGSMCVGLATADGGQVYIAGFVKPPVFDEESDDDPATENPPETLTPGDKVYKTSGGATIMLKRAGSVIVEGASGCGSIRMNPEDQTTTIRSNNLVQSHEGYRAVRGRREVGTTKPATWSREDYMHQAGGSHDRVRIQHGSFNGDGRRQLSIGSVTVVAGQSSTTIKTRETYYSDGSWVGEGPKYQWGAGASEQAVLGNQLVEAMNELIDIVKNLQVNTAWGPSTPPIFTTPIRLQQLESELPGKILSTYLFFSKDPVTLGTE